MGRIRPSPGTFRREREAVSLPGKGFVDDNDALLTNELGRHKA